MDMGFSDDRLLEFPEIIANIKDETGGGLSWFESEKTYDWTIHREQIRKMSEWIDDNDKSVIDFGAGECYLKGCLKPDVRYIPTDYIARTPDHVVFDFNKDEFPDIKADVCVLNQVLYFPENLESFLKNVFNAANKKVIIYINLMNDGFSENSIVSCHLFTSNKDIIKIAEMSNFRLIVNEINETEGDAAILENGMLFIKNEGLQ